MFPCLVPIHGFNFSFQTPNASFDFFGRCCRVMDWDFSPFFSPHRWWWVRESSSTKRGDRKIYAKNPMVGERFWMTEGKASFKNNYFELSFFYQHGWYCWWTKSCTTKDDDYPIIYRVLTIPGVVQDFFHQQYVTWKRLNSPWDANGLQYFLRAHPLNWRRQTFFANLDDNSFSKEPWNKDVRCVCFFGG